MSYAFAGGSVVAEAQLGTAVDGYPLTFSYALKVTAHPVLVDNHFHIGDVGANDANSHLVGSAATVNVWRSQTYDSASALSTCTITTNIDGVWAVFVYVLRSATDRQLYIQSIGNNDQNTTSRTFSAQLAHFVVGASLDAQNDLTGKVAEIGVWTSALSVPQVTDLLAFKRPSEVGSPIIYLPLSSAASTQLNLGSDSDGDLVITSGGTFDADHPVMQGSEVVPLMGQICM